MTEEEIEQIKKRPAPGSAQTQEEVEEKAKAFDILIGVIE